MTTALSIVQKTTLRNFMLVDGVLIIRARQFIIIFQLKALGVKLRRTFLRLCVVVL